MISQHWYRKWLGAARQQAIIWLNIDPDLYRHMASQCHCKLMLRKFISVIIDRIYISLQNICTDDIMIYNL